LATPSPIVLEEEWLKSMSEVKSKKVILSDNLMIFKAYLTYSKTLTGQ
jgi:hypothetical protein